jgi:hypothetical protein
MRIPVAKISELLHPTGRQVTPAVLAVAPRLKPQDEHQQRKQREKSGEREEQNAEKSFQTHIRHSERDRARDGEMKNGRQ